MGRNERISSRVSGLAGLLGLAFAALGAFGCATTGDGDGQGAHRTHYVLKQGATMPYPRPLPDRIDILVDWHYDNGAVQTVTGFRGWDFDGDGRFEMVEVLTEAGNTQAAVFDFDGDGRIDRTKDY